MKSLQHGYYLQLPVTTYARPAPGIMNIPVQFHPLQKKLKLVERDKAVLSYFGFEEHQLITAGLYKKRVDLLLPKLDLKKICGNCRWFEICNSKRGQVD